MSTDEISSDKPVFNQPAFRQDPYGWLFIWHGWKSALFILLTSIGLAELGKQIGISWLPFGLMVPIAIAFGISILNARKARHL